MNILCTYIHKDVNGKVWFMARRLYDTHWKPFPLDEGADEGELRFYTAAYLMVQVCGVV